MLSARWKGGADTAKKKAEPVAVGQVRSFRIVTLEAETETIRLKLI